jgi:O-antigen/teichoic acid export membrane protein
LAVEDVAPPAAASRPRVSGVTARLTVANMLTASSGFVTGPLLARALGASGRGDLAAILVPLSLVPVVLSLGIAPFAYRSLPRGRSLDEVVGSLGLPLLVLGLVGAACGFPIADVLAGGRATVRTFLIVGFLMTPLVLFNLLLSSSLAALERWHGVVAMNVIAVAVPFAATVVLFAIGRLTVGTAASASIAGSVLAVIPGLPLLASVDRPVVRPSLARAAAGFGLKSWPGGLAQTANARLDQLLMITVVSPRQLGLYAVATTISSASLLPAGALSPPLMSRIAAGHTYLMPQAVRMTIAVALGMSLAIAVVTPTVLGALFGPRFHAAVPIAMVLLAASVPLAGAIVLGTALQADGAPLIPSAAEMIALVITVVGLIVLLAPLQAMGAAYVSVAAYGASFLFQLGMARRRLGVPLSQFLLPSRADVHWARGVLGRAATG